jgi:hypothetical protein
MWNLEELKNKFQKLTEISESLLYDLERSEDEIIPASKSEIVSHPKIYKLIGNNPVDIISSLVKTHMEILKQSIRIKTPFIFLKVLPKFYSICSNRGFQDDYFKIEIVGIMSAFQNILSEHSKNLRAFYEWIFENNKFFIDQSQIKCCQYSNLEEKFIEQKNILLNHLLTGDERNAYSFIAEIIEKEALEDIYLYILYPVIDNLNFLREIGVICEFEFYFGLSIISRLIVFVYKKNKNVKIEKANVAVSSINDSDNLDFDELKNLKIYPGDIVSKLEARIINDSLNYSGIFSEYVDYKGLIEYLVKNKPPFLVITSVNPFNINIFGKLIERIKDIPELVTTKIYTLTYDHDGYEDFIKKLNITTYTQDLIKLYGGIKNV